MKNYSHLFFDCDGVILNSNKIKTDAFYKLALNLGELKAEQLVNYHLENGGISRYEKIKFFQKNILKNTNIKLYQELVDNYAPDWVVNFMGITSSQLVNNYDYETMQANLFLPLEFLKYYFKIKN